MNDEVGQPQAFLDAEFLRPDESNFELLIDKIRYLHRSLTTDAPPRPGRRRLVSQFSYADELPRVGLPAAPTSFEAATERSSEAFDGALNWHHPHALFNINPSPLLDTVALTTMTALYNPNAIWDISSGKFTLIERRTISHLAQLAGWNHPAGGAFTSGGRATLMYAIKSGINRCDPDAIDLGLRHRYAVLVSANAHFSVESVCNYLGLGKSAVRRIDHLRDGRMDTDALEAAFRRAVADNVRVACVILSGGGTINLAIDPVDRARAVVERVALAAGLPYVPHIHLDTVISWAWLAYTRDWPRESTATLPVVVQDKIDRAARAITGVRFADSFSADFHKTGLSPYAASVYITKHAEQFADINRGMADPRAVEERFGEVCNFDRTLENSRSCTGIIASYHVLQRLGVQGIQDHVTRLLCAAARLVDAITDGNDDLVKVLNPQTLGFDIVARVNLLRVAEPGWDEPPATPDEDERYQLVADRFYEWLIHGRECNDTAVPFLGYVPRYTDAASPRPTSALLLYPNSIHLDDNAAADIATSLRRAILTFRDRDLAMADGPQSSWLDRPLPPR